MQRKGIPKPTQGIPRPAQGAKGAKPVQPIKKEPPNVLPKDWVELEKNVMIVNGSCSQSHKKYKGHNEQSAAVCIVACVFSSLCKMSSWTRSILDQIIEIGTNLHLKTRQMSDNKCSAYIEPPQVYKYFFIDDIKVSTKVGVDVVSEKVPRSSTMLEQLENVIDRFFANHTSGVFSCLQTHFAIWKIGKYFFIFDPLEHSPQGGKWNGLPGLGFCYAMRCTTPKRLADTILKNITLKQVNKITIYPCAVEKAVKVNTVPPESPEGRPPSEVEKPKIQKKSRLVPPSTPTPSPLVRQSGSKTSATAPEGGEMQPKPSVSLSRIPPERPRLKSVTNFVELLDGRVGILRASTHQCDPKFTRYLGAQGLANAVAALTMLRQHKSKSWIRAVLDDILKLGEVIHHDSKKLPPGQIATKVTLKDKDYAPKIDRYGTIGRLQSDVDKILSLDQALGNFLLDNDCCILVGPVIAAIWKEDDRFFMFDPNERDAAGKTVKPNEPGVACVTWFTKLADLVGLYMENVPMQERKDRFVLSRATIKDYEPVAEDWCNFRALTFNKWILRGSFSQQDRRFPAESRNAQCTANATMALAYKELLPEREWDATTVDQVLLDGDEFYRGCIDHLRENNKLKHRFLMVDELKRHFDVKNKRVDLEIDDCLVNGVINAKSDTGIPNLKRGFEEFFTIGDAAVVTANLQSMAVWRKDETYYYYDSHSRNEKGIVCGKYLDVILTNSTTTICAGAGTACVLRMVNIDDLTNALMTNFGADPQNLYNISRIVVNLIDLTEEGVVKPPLNHYESISDLVAILRSNLSENHKKFGLNVGKQTVPMCLAAFAMNALTSSSTWSKEDLDQVLVIGDRLYLDSMEANYVEDLPEEFNVDEISTNNVKRHLKIGTNSFDIDFDMLAQGNIEDNLTEAVNNLYEFSQHEGAETFQGILESLYMTASLWRDDVSIYLFDPKPRDERGQIYGKDDWSAKIVIPEVYPDDADEEIDEVEHERDEEVELDEMGGGDNFGPVADVEQVEEVKMEVRYEPSASPDDGAEELGETAQAEVFEPPPPKEKKGSAFWRSLEEEGKACVMRFSRVEDLVSHLLENSPPNQRQGLDFTLKAVKINNTPVLREIYDPENEDRKDEFVGDWNGFREVDYGKWILRSVRNYKDDLFPGCNRGRQEVAMCMVALAFVDLYAVSKFKQVVVDAILAYGDRFYTVLRRMREKELKSNKDLGLSEAEIEEILKRTDFKIADYPRSLCMGEKLAKWDAKMEATCGDITSKIPETIPDIPKGLESFFSENAYGILQCRDYSVAVWKLDDIFYMFDPHPTGPSGGKSLIGVACITRFKNVEDLGQIFLNNLPKVGCNFFEIHAFTFEKDQCKRERKPEVKEEKSPKLGGFAQVMAGKHILRGTSKLDCTKFDRGVHLHSSAIAFAALAVSLAMEPDTWTRMLINEILEIGEELYSDTIERLSSKFNAWEDRLDIYRLNTDFKVGSLKANCALRFREQRGVVDVKNAKVPNLRQGLERFFQENSHGVLIAGKFTLAVWEEAKGKDVHIYVFDPNSRGATGLPAQGGVACAMKFCNAKVAADH
ncbi:uncharacterized protein BDFB_004743, partial [Asbolus verrucosus]